MTDVSINAPVASATTADASEDYFTVEDFRERVGDLKVPYRFDAEDILRGQQEVVERLEAWAKTSWRVRSSTEIRYQPVALMTLRRIPVISGSFVATLAGTTLTEGTDFTLDYHSGVFRYGDWVLNPVVVSIASPWSFTYDYGFDGVPESVLRSCVQATESLLGWQEGRSTVPRNATRYSSERTEITLGRRGQVPWPWDPRASDDIRSFWELTRPKGYVS